MNNKKWNIFLSLQGNDENSLPPDKKIVRPFSDTYKMLNDFSVFNYFNLPTYKKIIVIGAGDGAEVVSFLIRGYNVIGTTLHHSDKKYAKMVYNIDLVIEDMHNMESIQSNFFDGIYSYHTLEHSISPLIALYEMRRILKYNGKILCILPSSGTIEENGLQHYSVLRNKHWKHLLDIIGFDNIEITQSNTDNIITIKAIKGNRDCPGKHFEEELNKLCTQ